MKQPTLAMAADQGEGFEQHRRATRRDVFLSAMEQIVPWSALCAVIEPHYPKAGKGRPPVGLERMLRMYFVQHWFNLADEACEEALLDSTALRRFVGIDLGRERVPDGTTLLKFRRLLEKHELGAALFAQVNQSLQDRGLKVGTGTIVDATIITPAIPLIGTRWPNTACALVCAKTVLLSRTSGNIAAGTSSIFSRSGHHCCLWMSYISVREALLTSVAWVRSSDRFHNSQLSMVPNSNSPRSARLRAPGTWSRIHLTLVPLK